MPSLLGLNFHKKKSSDSMKGLSLLHSMNREDSRKLRSNQSNPNQEESVNSVLSPGSNQHQQHNRSFNELTRFFRSSMRKKSTISSQMNFTKSSEHQSHTHSVIAPSSDSSLSFTNKTSIHHDDSILSQKYGKLGRVLGTGAGGSVKLLVRSSDGKTFAVKQFRPRRSGESVKDYARKCTSEYMIGSMLHHPNIIETLDVFSDSKQNQYYEVMEYCSVDFFAVVMSGKMSRGEISCCFKQLVEGVSYLHSKGYSHRDLKLDNCVMTRDGILKLIDFGSAFIFKYAYEADEKPAHGVVGSDPYLAPEVLKSTKRYSAPLVDVWSIAIIFCCMMLKRFPWKEPRLTDNNFKVYCMLDDQEHDYDESAKEHEMLIKKRREERKKEKHIKPELESKLVTSPDVKRHYLQDQLSGTTEDNEQRLSTAQSLFQKYEKEKTTQINFKHNNTESNVPEENKDKLEKIQTDIPEKVIEFTEACSKASKDEDPALAVSSLVSNKSIKQKKPIHGPYILLRLLPHASRPLISRMLQVDPVKRARMQDVLNDEWYKSISHCTMDENRRVLKASNHSHTIVSEENSNIQTTKV